MTADRPILVGLTGSIGMGKSETAKMFARLSIPVYDADAAVHALYEPGGAAVAAIAEAFPGAVKNNRVDRDALARQIGGNPAEFAKLESIVHPLVGIAQREFIEAAQAKGAKLVVLDIPLLYETGADARMDAVVVVSARQDLQRERVLSREGMTEEKLDHILARQMSDAEKRAKAHYIVETDKGRVQAFEQVQKIVAELYRRRAENQHA
ncbi:MAG: dephospho-CoA kinase [Rhizomicrobium sp.]